MNGSHRAAEAGYSMVALMVAVTIMTILVAMALPMWSQRMQREKEEELIFRGWQYAEAIRVFQQRHGRLPTRLNELIEVEPRSIRQLWKDPMTEDGEWGIVVQVGAGAPRQQNPPTDENGRPQPPGPGGQQPEGVCVGASGGEDEEGGGRPRGSRGPASGGRGRSGGDQQVTGPILGVCSRAPGEAIKVLFGEEEYSKWHFTVQRLGGGGVAGIGPEGVQGSGGGPLQPHTGGTPTLPRARWIGRPFRPGVQPETGAPPAGSLPGGATPNDRQKRP